MRKCLLCVCLFWVLNIRVRGSRVLNIGVGCEMCACNAKLVQQTPYAKTDASKRPHPVLLSPYHTY